jgi:predicted glycoside hydrolase/deacetylase ChbG (UPF0249 family)
MSKKNEAVLVVNADDFGLTEGTNHAIIDAHTNGIVTSTSLLANGFAFHHAVALAQRNPLLGVGVHLTLTEVPPLTDGADRVPAFRGPGGRFPLSNQPMVQELLAGRLPREAIRREFEAQIRGVIDAGIKPTHIDGHKYIHLLPGISGIAADVARQAGIGVMRVPHRLADPLLAGDRFSRLPGAFILVAMSALAYRTARRAGLRAADWIGGFVDTGHLDQATIRRLLWAPRSGVTELLCHPAYRTPALELLLAQGFTWIAGYDFDRETAAVSDPGLRHELEAAGWELRNFRTAAQSRDPEPGREQSD